MRHSLSFAGVAIMAAFSFSAAAVAQDVVMRRPIPATPKEASHVAAWVVGTYDVAQMIGPPPAVPPQQTTAPSSPTSSGDASSSGGM